MSLVDRCTVWGWARTPVPAFLRSLEPLALGEDNAVARQLAASALDLIGLALADRFGAEGSPNAGRTKHFLRACTYMNAYASDPDLTPARIASSTGVRCATSTPSPLITVWR